MSDTLLNPYFGEFGGMYVPEILIPVLQQLEKAFVEAKDDPAFQQEFQDLLKAADKARRQFEYHLQDNGGGTETDLLEKDGSLFVKSEYKIIRINVADICYIEGMSEYVRIYTDAADKPVVTLLSMRKLEERLPQEMFMRVHRSYIVNLRKITEVSRLRIIFNKNIYIPVGDNYKERFTEYINKICVSS